MYLYFDEDNKPSKRLELMLYNSAIACARHEELDPDRLTVSVSFVDADTIHQLNKQYRNVDRVTDVLSFPQFDCNDYIEGWEEVNLGDVVMCMDKIKEQAAEFGHSEDRETLYLFTHSVLHLLGYDHETEEDKAEMRKVEEKIMLELDLAR